MWDRENYYDTTKISVNRNPSFVPQQVKNYDMKKTRTKVILESSAHEQCLFRKSALPVGGSTSDLPYPVASFQKMPKRRRDRPDLFSFCEYYHVIQNFCGTGWV